MIIAGDVGGTKVHLALFEKARDPIYQKKYQSRNFAEFHLLLQEFMDSAPVKQILAACFGVAGSVHQGRCHTTNLPWVIDATALQKIFSIEQVDIINDLEANAWGVGVLGVTELYTLNAGKSMTGNGALIAAGTGLGEAGLYWNGHRHMPFACEGGHADFAPTTEEEVALWRYLKQQFDHVSYERILSGSGIFRLYRFLVDTGREPENPQVAGKGEREEPQKIITQQALEQFCPTCLHALRLFISIYGTESGNLALKMLARSAFYIGGGIAPQIIHLLKEGQFMEAFVSKGRFRTLLEEIPVQVILNDQTALLGAAVYAQRRR